MLSKLEARPYVAVVIDSDGYVFRRLSEGSRGGEEVADALHAQVVAAVKERLGFVTKCDVLVEAYANMDGLGRAMVKKGNLRSVDELREFWIGFVYRQRLFNFVDVGFGKERADHKVRGKKLRSLHATCHEC